MNGSFFPLSAFHHVQFSSGLAGSVHHFKPAARVLNGASFFFPIKKIKIAATADIAGVN